MSAADELSVEVQMRLKAIDGVPQDPVETIRKTFFDVALKWVKEHPEKAAQAMAELLQDRERNRK